MTQSMIIRPLASADFPAWQPLWDSNNLGIGDGAVTTETWNRLTDENNVQVNGLGAFEHNQLRGFVHYILHPTTGSIAPVCYMQDVFVDPDHRRKGIAKALVTKLAEIGKQEKWTRIYWLAESGNTAAQNLYKNHGIKLDFTLHVLPLAPSSS